MTMFLTVIGKFWSFYPLIVAFLQLPKLATWKDADVFYTYIYKFVNSDFLALLVAKTPFYVDDKLLDKLQTEIGDKERFITVYNALTELTSITQDNPLWDIYNFVRTVWSLRSVL